MRVNYRVTLSHRMLIMLQSHRRLIMSYWPSSCYMERTEIVENILLSHSLGTPRHAVVWLMDARINKYTLYTTTEPGCTNSISKTYFHRYQRKKTNNKKNTYNTYKTVSPNPPKSLPPLFIKATTAF